MNIDTQKTSFKEVVKIVRWSFSLAWKYEPWLLVGNITCNILIAVFSYLQLASFSNIVDKVIALQGTDNLISRGLLIQMGMLGLSFIIPSVIRMFETKNEAAFRPKLHTHLQAMHIDKFSKLDIAVMESSDFQKKLAFANEWGLGSIPNVLFNSIDTLKNMVSVATAAIILILIKPVLVILAIIGSIPTYFSENKFGKMLFRAYNEQTDGVRIIQDRRAFFFGAQKLIEVAIFNIANKFKSELISKRREYDNNIIVIGSKRAIALLMTDIFALLLLFSAIIVIIHAGITGTIAIGAMILAFSSYRNFGTSTTMFFTSVTRVQEQVRYAVRWYEIYQIKPSIVSKPNAITPNWSRPPKIEFKDIEFAYPETEKTVLRKINLTIEPGQKLALVGLNGAGKTTLVKLLARIYDPTGGIILVDGVDLRDIDVDYWRSNLGILFQNFSNFQMSAREAIAISRPNIPIDNKKVIDAAEKSGAIDFIKDFPKQYDQIIWKGYQDGVELSQGQHQRMAVARILYRDALISILDEPTSAIDAVAEERIFEVLETKLEGKTGILISHRFSTVKNADNIAVIEHGELKELGNHKELMKKNGRYAELYNMQASRYLEDIEV